jgi:hypothetical protein
MWVLNQSASYFERRSKPIIMHLAKTQKIIIWERMNRIYSYLTDIKSFLKFTLLSYKDAFSFIDLILLKLQELTPSANNEYKKLSIKICI